MVTSKDFNAISAIMKSASLDLYKDDHADICQDLSDYFKSQNPRFKRELFLNACGVN